MVLTHLILLATTTAKFVAALPLDSNTSPLPRSDVYFNVQQAAAGAVPLDKQLMGLSIEFGNAVDYFGGVDNPNAFSKQLLQNIVDRSRNPAILRIGGNTQDRASFCENCNQTMSSIVLNDPNDPKGTEAVEVTFNKNLFNVLTTNVPTGTPIIFGLNFRNNSYSLAQAEIDSAFRYIDQSLVMAYELGNEVNLYGDFRPPDYDVNDYASQMREWIPRLRARSSATSSFQFPSFAGPELFKPDMSISELVRLNVPQSIPGIEYFSVHGYPWNICTDEDAAKVDLRNLLDHQQTLALLDQYSSEISAAKPLGKMIHMGETGSVACHGKDGVSNTLGAALWQLDYALTGATAGIDRFFFHNGKGDFYYSTWEPLPTDTSPVPHINPTYYSMLFIADLVADLKVPRVAPITSLDSSSAVHFAIYDNDQIQKLVILNMAYFNGTTTRSRREFNVASSLGSNLRVRRLTGQSSDARTGVTWAGQSVDASGSIIGDLSIEKVSTGLVTLLSSEAVIVERE
ncbi:hypothetical protein ABOM_011758 [Aspergillus bombycis]|uniref:Beta-glucuronidase C-terminal domain-containing protein n=1 Tax=Aspergillus bombycis TaxID=109264 RepID=A0A1F7ZJU9_9EURO|nr:hypothetical protein ABOM_011758 [Aspergillus bombycis]OGM39579.1 hypothetical protein ABOM_011758 [Aspergillus bombycis]